MYKILTEVSATFVMTSLGHSLVRGLTPSNLAIIAIGAAVALSFGGVAAFTDAFDGDITGFLLMGFGGLAGGAIGGALAKCYTAFAGRHIAGNILGKLVNGAVKSWGYHAGMSMGNAMASLPYGKEHAVKILEHELCTLEGNVWGTLLMGGIGISKLGYQALLSGSVHHSVEWFLATYTALAVVDGGHAAYETGSVDVSRTLRGSLTKAYQFSCFDVGVGVFNATFAGRVARTHAAVGTAAGVLACVTGMPLPVITASVSLKNPTMGGWPLKVPREFGLKIDPAKKGRETVVFGKADSPKIEEWIKKPLEAGEIAELAEMLPRLRGERERPAGFLLACLKLELEGVTHQEFTRVLGEEGMMYVVRTHVDAWLPPLSSVARIGLQPSTRIRCSLSPTADRGYVEVFYASGRRMNQPRSSFEMGGPLREAFGDGVHHAVIDPVLVKRGVWASLRRYLDDPTSNYADDRSHFECGDGDGRVISVSPPLTAFPWGYDYKGEYYEGDPLVILAKVPRERLERWGSGEGPFVPHLVGRGLVVMAEPRSVMEANLRSMMEANLHKYETPFDYFLGVLRSIGVDVTNRKGIREKYQW